MSVDGDRNRRLRRLRRGLGLDKSMPGSTRRAGVVTRVPLNAIVTQEEGCGIEDFHKFVTATSGGG
jgi:hypothetical protein